MTKSRRLENTNSYTIRATIDMHVDAEAFPYARNIAREELEGQGYVVVSIADNR